MLVTKTMPHLLLYGPPGTGKTSIILAFAKELFGINHYKKRILELNASDDRGIGKIREKVYKKIILTLGQKICSYKKRKNCELS